ncbi:MAG TPA: sugar phosphate isomerase/epimerase, partial [Candidatus Bathyarchaeota archaeon]|nr:sugar phosphate isomerase/epimerase [Candidatus Bathyarchaeota archaeon]
PGLLTGLHMHFPGAEWDAMLRSVRELAARAEELGLTILIENGPDPVPFLLKRAAQFRRFFEELGEGVRLGVAFDVGHAHICGQVEELLKALAGQIGHVHAHDNNGRQDEHLAIGEGTVDWPGVLEGLRAVGYDGPVVVESVRKPFESLRALAELLP